MSHKLNDKFFDDMLDILDEMEGTEKYKQEVARRIYNSVLDTFGGDALPPMWTVYLSCGRPITSLRKKKEVAA